MDVLKTIKRSQQVSNVLQIFIEQEKILTNFVRLSVLTESIVKKNRNLNKQAHKFASTQPEEVKKLIHKLTNYIDHLSATSNVMNIYSQDLINLWEKDTSDDIENEELLSEEIDNHKFEDDISETKPVDEQKMPKREVQLW